MTLPYNMPEDMDPSLYWHFRIFNNEWLYYVNKLSKLVASQVADPIKDKATVLLYAPDKPSVALFKRQYVSAAVVSKFTGLSEERLASLAYIDLKFAMHKDIPLPTVSYWGEA